jgi:hypothetical protein
MLLTVSRHVVSLTCLIFLRPFKRGIAPVNKPFDCFLPNAFGVSYFKLERGGTVL